MYRVLTELFLPYGEVLAFSDHRGPADVLNSKISTKMRIKKKMHFIPKTTRRVFLESLNF